MNDLTPAAQAALTLANHPLFAAPQQAGALSAGIKPGCSNVSIRGSRWHIKKGAEERTLTTADGAPSTVFDVVILEADTEVSRTYYAGAYVQGNNDDPDCYSRDGKLPAADAASPQAASCAACPHAVWGSKIIDGKKSVSCRGHITIAVVPVEDIPNADHGGAMRLNIPGGSFTGLSAYDNHLTVNGASHRSVVTRLGFDPQASYPLVTFTPQRFLSDEEKMQVIEVHDTVKNVIEPVSEPVAHEAPAPAPAPVAVAPAPAPAPVAVAPAPAPVAPLQAVPATPNPTLSPDVPTQADMFKEDNPAGTPAETAPAVAATPKGDKGDNADRTAAVAEIDELMEDFDLG